MNRVADTRRTWEQAETILLRGARVIDPAAGLDEERDIFLRRGHVEGVAPAIAREADLTIDLGGLVCAPGFGDLHVHLREPGNEDAETIASGSRAAALGGYTRVACMPNTAPPLDSRGLVEFVIRRANEAGHCRVYPVAAATKGRAGEHLTEIRELQQAGALAVSDDGSPVASPLVMRRLLEYARTWDQLVISHCEEPRLSNGGIMNEGYWSTILGLPGIPAAAEMIAVDRDVRLAELTGARLHVAHVSTRGAVAILRAAKERGAAVTAETAPHYFALTDEALKTYDSVNHVNPPLRGEEDRAAVVEGLRDGTLDIIACDHAPHTSVAKDQELRIAPPGMIGLETTVALGLEYLHHRADFPLADVVRLLATRPAEIAGWGGGRIRPGEAADLTVFAPGEQWTVDAQAFASLGRNCPFHGWTPRGRVRMTVCDGRLTHEEELEFCPSERLQSQLV